MSFENCHKNNDCKLRVKINPGPISSSLSGITIQAETEEEIKNLDRIWNEMGHKCCCERNGNQITFIIRP